MTKARYATLRRWWDLAAYAALAAGFWAGVVRLWPDTSELLIELPLVGVLCLAGVLLGLICREGCGRMSAFLGLRHPFAYPPLWFAGAVGAVLFLTLESCAPSFTANVYLGDFPPLWLPFGIVPASLLVLAIGHGIVRLVGAARRTAVSQDDPNEEQSENGFPLDNPLEIVEWVRDDRPIRDPSQDRFGLARISRRIADRLARNAGSQLIVGDLGSGKTSLLHLTRWQLKRIQGGERVRVVHVELWQYDSAPAAVAGIIRALTIELAEHVNIVGVLGLRGQYLRAMYGTGGAGAALANVLQGEEDPYKTLDAIDAIAAAIDIRLVVWIEDVERFLDGGLNSAGADAAFSTDREIERLNPVRSLVHGLDRLDQISVVTASTTMMRRFDHEKIARFVEELPRLNENQVSQIIFHFRESMVHAFPEDVPITRNSPIDKMIGHKSNIIFMTSAVDFIESLRRSIPLMLSDPRRIKIALRRANEAWRALHGEIDPDHLILISILAESSPDGYSIVRDNYDDIVYHDKNDHASAESKLSAFANSIRMSDNEKVFLNAIVNNTIYPNRTGHRPQGLHKKRYWRRLMNLRLPEGEARDQELLQAIHSNNPDSIADVIANRSGENFYPFSELIPTDALFSLLLPICKKLAEFDWYNAFSIQNAFAGRPIVIRELRYSWETRLNFLEKAERNRLLDTIESQLEESIAHSLDNIELLEDIETHLIHGSEDSLSLVLSADTARGKAILEKFDKRIRTRLVDHYRERPRKLATAIRRSSEWSFKRLLWGPKRIKDNKYDEPPFDRWAELAPTFVEAAREDPYALVELAIFVTRERGNRMRASRNPVLVYDSALCIRLFESEEEILDLPWHSEVPEGRSEFYLSAMRKAVGKRKQRSATDDEATS